MYETVSNNIDTEEKEHIFDEKLEQILKVAENIRRMAEIEADEILNNAKKRASALKGEVTEEISKEKSINETLEKTEETTELKEKGRELFGACSRDVFRIILERERSRTDRNGHELALIIFDLSEENNAKFIVTLIRAMKLRARTVDRFGWYSDGLIGAVLPNTTRKGGMKFAHDICKKVMKKKSSPPDFKVYSYPTKWLPTKSQLIKEKLRSRKQKPIEFIDGVDPVFVKKMPVWKRILDVFVSLIVLLFTSPIFIFVPLIIKIVSPGPVFFKQDRVGYGGRIFTFLKFRTMKVNTDTTTHENYLNELIKTEKPMIKLDKGNDPRIIPFGTFFRKSCIDELPQLFNVLKGEMSLIGPRPCLTYEAREYLKWHKYRFDIKPGMSGLWQVSGKNRLSFKEMIRLDIKYAKKFSIWMDLSILFLTVPAVISLIIEKFAIDSFFNKVEKKQIPEEQFKDFLKHYYSDVYNVDKLEFLDDKLKNYNVDLMEVALLLAKMHRLTPSYNVAKRYFGILRLIDFEKKSQSRNVNHTIHS